MGLAALGASAGACGGTSRDDAAGGNTESQYMREATELACAPDAYCPNLVGGADRRCAARIAIGAACDPIESSCVHGAYCTEAGVCAEQKAEGATGTSMDECRGGCVCPDGLCMTESEGVCLGESAAAEGVGLVLLLMCGGSSS
jgi:hypothetical protein